MPNKANKPVGEFEENGVKITIFAKKDEDPAHAIERVAKRHDVPVRAIKKLGAASKEEGDDKKGDKEDES